MKIEVSLIGMPKTKIDGNEVVFPYRKVQGLFYYLCVNKIVSRDEVLGIFWADSSEDSARKNVRDALYHLKKIFGNEVISVEGNNRIELILDDYSIDYFNITDENILDTYTGDFLGYFYVKKCLEFENWVSEIRNDLMFKYENALNLKIEEAVNSKDSTALISLGIKLLQRHIYDEAAIRQIMEVLAENGNYEDALRIYKKFSDQMETEFEDEPEQDTKALYLKLMEGQKNNKINKTKRESMELYCRDEELRAIRDELFLFQSCGEKARSILLIGESGVGKSVTIKKAREYIDSLNCLLFSFQCVQNEQHLMLKPWRDIVKKIISECGDLGVDLKAEGLAEIYEDVSVVPSQFEIYIENIFQTIMGYSKKEGIVIVLDDIQWLDYASRSLLINIISWGISHNTLIIMSSRNDDIEGLYDLENSLVSAGVLRKIPINCFTIEETRTIIRALRPEIADDNAVVTRIHKRTGGNAFFLFELLREKNINSENVKLSRNVVMMIQNRLEYLTGEARSLLDTISIFPRFATLSEMEFLLGDRSSEILEMLKELTDRHLICENSNFFKTGYGFSHQIIRDYIYGKIPREKKRRMHASCAHIYEKKYIESREVNFYLLPSLIYHFSKCGDIFKEYTYHLEYLQFFYSVGHELYPNIFRTRISGSDIPPIGGNDGLVELVEKIRELHNKSPEAAELRMRAEFLIGRYDLFSGSLKRGLENIYVSIGIAKQINDAKYLMENYLQIVFYTIQVNNIQLFDEYITSCEKIISKTTLPDMYAYTVRRLRGVYHMKKDNYIKAREEFIELLKEIETHHSNDSAYTMCKAACYNYLGEIHQAAGELDEAFSYYIMAINGSDSTNAYNSRGVFHTNAGYALFLQGKEKPAQLYINNAIRCFEKCDALWGRSKVHSYAAMLSINSGNWKEARQHIKEAEKNVDISGNPLSKRLLEEVKHLYDKKMAEEKKVKKTKSDNP